MVKHYQCFLLFVVIGRAGDGRLAKELFYWRREKCALVL